MAPRKKLKIMYTHVDGYSLDKWVELRIRLQTDEVDVVALTGIKSSDGLVTHEVREIPGYRCYKNKWDELSNRGVCVYVSTRLKSTVHEDQLTDSLQVVIDNELALQCVSESSTNRQQLRSSINKRFQLRNHSPLIIGTVRKILKLSDEVKSTNVPMSGDEEGYYFTISARLFEIEGGHPSLGDSVHEVFFLILPLIPSRQKLSQTYNYGYDKVNPSRYAIHPNGFEELSVEASIDLMYDRIYKPYFKKVPLRRSGPDISPTWVSQRMKKDLQLKHEEWYSMRNGLPNTYDGTNRNLNSAYIKAKSEFEKQLVDLAKEDPSVMAEYALFTNDHTDIDHVCTMYGERIDDKKQMVEAFAEEFHGNFVKEDRNAWNFKPNRSGKKLQLDQLVAKEEDVLDLIQTSKCTGPGPDRFKPEVVKHLAYQMTHPITVIINKCLQDPCSIPDKWKVAKVVPKYKRGDRYSVGNYRPISVTSYICKLMERLVVAHIDKSFVEGGVLTKYQHGYKHGRSSTTNLLASLDVCTEWLSQGLAVDIVYLDLAKAYDSVPHVRLLKILDDLGVHGRLLSWIERFLIGRQQYVEMHGEKSDLRNVISGVPQGSVISNLLFMIFMNNLPTLVGSEIFMYCDDVKLVAPVIRSANGTYKSALQADIVALNKWATEMQMSFGVKKCKVLHLGKNNPKLSYVIQSNTGAYLKLEAVETHVDLGVHIDTQLKFTDHCNHVFEETMERILLMKQKFTFISSEVLKTVFCQDIRGKIEYATCVYSPVLKIDEDVIEFIQKRAVMAIHDMPTTWGYSTRLKKLGLPTLKFRRKRADLIQFYRYYNNSDKLMKSFRLVPGRHSCTVFTRELLAPVRENFFFERAARDWNRLSEDTVTCTNVNDFTASLDAELEGEHMYQYEFAAIVT